MNGVKFTTEGHLLVVHRAIVEHGNIVQLMPNDCFHPFDESKEYVVNTIVYSNRDNQPVGVLKYVLKGSEAFDHFILMEKLSTEKGKKEFFGKCK